jgi:hypothetical protein
VTLEHFVFSRACDLHCVSSHRLSCYPYDARSAAVNLWSHHWLNDATRQESETIGTFYFRWGDTSSLYEIETDEGFSLEDLMRELGRLELAALGFVKHGDVPRPDPLP